MEDFLDYNQIVPSWSVNYTDYAVVYDDQNRSPSQFIYIEYIFFTQFIGIGIIGIRLDIL